MMIKKKIEYKVDPTKAYFGQTTTAMSISTKVVALYGANASEFTGEPGSVIYVSFVNGHNAAANNPIRLNINGIRNWTVYANNSSAGVSANLLNYSLLGFVIDSTGSLHVVNHIIDWVE